MAETMKRGDARAVRSAQGERRRTLQIPFPYDCTCRDETKEL
jgi:hypothetical protein